MMNAILRTWYKKKSEPLQDAPSLFTMEDNKQIVEVNLTEEESFLDINCKKLTYAEVAAMLAIDEPLKPLPKTGIRRKSAARTTLNSFAVLDTVDDVSNEDHGDTNNNMDSSVWMDGKIRSGYHDKKTKIQKDKEKRRALQGM